MADPSEKPVEIDEQWLAEWFSYGWEQLLASLRSHAAFDQYLKEREADE